MTGGGALLGGHDLRGRESCLDAASGKVEWQTQPPVKERI